METTLILMRHGQSAWNQKNLFTGWVDIPLNQKGVEEALEGGKKIAHLPIDKVFTSSLLRAHMTVVFALFPHHSGRVPRFLHREEEGRQGWNEAHGTRALEETIPVIQAWELNERMYGELQGLDKAETAARFGKEQVQRWRRSFGEAPPGGESLKDTAARAIPYFEKEIVPCLAKGERVFIAAHGNSLRSLVMHLENLSQEEVVALEIATGAPLVYTYAGGRFSRCTSF